MNRLVFVDRNELCANRRFEPHRVTRLRTHDQRHRPPILLQVREVHVGEGIMSEAPIPRAPYHPDDLTRRLPRAAAELALNMFPDRVFAREVAPGEGLVDDHDRLSAFRVMVVEEPPRAQ